MTSDWLCHHCGHSVPESMDLCWSCGTTREGEVDPDFAQEADATSAEPTGEPIAAPRIPRTDPPLQCPRCGSSKVIPSVHVCDRSDHGTLSVVVYGNPSAILFKDRLFTDVSADVCGQCGHMEMRAVKPEELYEHYLKAIGP